MIAPRRLWPALLLGFALAGCSAEVADTEKGDPSKLSEELERRAEQIEEKADMAAVAAEREAAAELESLRAQAAEAEDGVSSGGAGEPSGEAD